MFTIDNILNDRPLSKNAKSPQKRQRLDENGAFVVPISDSNIKQEDSKLVSPKLEKSSPIGLCLSQTKHELKSPKITIKEENCTDKKLSVSKRKKPRACFSQEQLDGLETAFQNKRYLSASERKPLVAILGLTDLQVKTWYQNRRMKEKRVTEAGSYSSGLQTTQSAILMPTLPVSGFISTNLTCSIGIQSPFVPLSIITPPMSTPYPYIMTSPNVHSSEPLLKIVSPVTVSKTNSGSAARQMTQNIEKDNVCGQFYKNISPGQMMRM